MIVKHFETHKINLKLNKFILLYGKNEGLKNETISILTKDKKNAHNHDEKEILENQNSFLESILSKSLFDEEKIIIIKRSSDKILKIIDDLYKKNIQDVTIILNADSLEKKSKLRTFFEKEKNLFA